MKIIKNFTFVFLTLVLMSGCGKDKVDQKSSDKMTEKKDAITEQKNTNENKSVANKTSDDIKLYKVDKVEKASGKKSAPNVIWTESGKENSISSLKGNVILVNFWATWCGPCIKEMPDLSAISEELKDKNFKMIGMNVFQQEGSKKVADFLTSKPVSYMVLDGNQAVVDAFSEANGSLIEAVPTTFIIDKEGKIAETIVGGRDKASFLKIINKYMN